MQTGISTSEPLIISDTQKTPRYACLAQNKTHKVDLKLLLQFGSFPFLFFFPRHKRRNANLKPTAAEVSFIAVPDVAELVRVRHLVTGGMTAFIFVFGRGPWLVVVLRGEALVPVVAL